MTAFATEAEDDIDPRGEAALLLRRLHSGAEGLDEREAARRLVAHGRNELEQRAGRSWVRELFHQLVHPLALLLWLAAGLAAATGSVAVAIAIVAVKSSKRRRPLSCSAATCPRGRPWSEADDT
jgi:magnesium-transporting ATPase (P-type)